MSNVKIGLFNRVILNYVLLLDQNSDTLLQTAHLSAKIHLLPLLEGKIRLSSLQLYGYDIRLRREAPNQPYNFQFVIDAFSSKDTTESSPIDLSIGAAIIRRGTLRHDLTYEPQNDQFSPAHFCLNDLSLKAAINIIKDDSINIKFNHLSFIDSQSALRVERLGFVFIGNQHEAHLSDFMLQLPSSDLSIPNASTTFDLEASKVTSVSGLMKGFITPSDFAPLLPFLRSFSDPLTLTSTFSYDHEEWHLPSLQLKANGLQLDTECWLRTSDTFSARANLRQLELHEAFRRPLLNALSASDGERGPILPASTASMLERIGDIGITGRASYSKSLSTADINVLTSIGKLNLKGNISNDDLQVRLESEDVRLAKLLSADETFPVDHVTLQASGEGKLKRGTIKTDFEFQNLLVGEEILDIIKGSINIGPHHLESLLSIADPHFEVDLTTSLTSDKNWILSPEIIDDMHGNIHIDRLTLNLPDKKYSLNDLLCTISNSTEGQHFTLDADFIHATASGHFNYAELQPLAQQMLHRALPSLIPSSDHSLASSHDFTIVADIMDVKPLQLLGIDIAIDETAHIEGSLQKGEEEIKLSATFPHLVYGQEDLRHIALQCHLQGEQANAALSFQRIMETGSVDISLSATAEADTLHSNIAWDDHGQPAMNGMLRTTSKFFKDQSESLGADITIHPTQITIHDTIWNIHPSQLTLHDKIIDVRNFNISQMGRHLKVRGLVGSSPTDTLFAELADIDLQYVFGLLDFHAVELAGLATGNVLARGLMSNPIVDASLDVKQFSLNEGILGTLQVTGGWSRKKENTIDLDAYITEPVRHQVSHIQGTITPGSGPDNGLNLDINSHYLNIYFLNDYTSSFFTNLQGHATGWAHLYGPFSELDLEGDLVVDTASTTIDVLGSRYHLYGDSVHMRPGRLFVHGATAYDALHGTDRRFHQAKVSGEVRHNHFSDFRYHFDFDAKEFLCYDFKDFGDEIFYGTVYATGRSALNGEPGRLNCDMEGAPTIGTVFTYNASSPEAITNDEMITYISSKAKSTEDSTSFVKEEEEIPSATDIFLTFNLNVTPEATMRLLMDARSEDYITLTGNGHMRATYYNKGRFQLYGAYHVDHGNYLLSLQDVIRKDFQLQRDGTIVFGGAPMQADLNLQAIYTVPSVSLNDLAAGSNFSSTGVRVNCLMNITGHASQPQVSFDFDLPNVNEDEKRMVRSLISTEEERNMQVIYLLGVGRFYTYGAGPDQDQTTTAMNGLLSSTLSGQVNNLLRNAVGDQSGSWSFGTNFSTGQLGWSDMDVEGMLSGRLLNNRLLINGTFGYRDTPVANSNFVGDFDVQWLLNPRGTLSLKAYSETNDRYFTKTALTTQGIGIQMRKDFNSLRELFQRKK